MGFKIKKVVKMKGIVSLPLFSTGYDGEKRALIFDFNRVIPMPETLKMKVGYMERLAIEATLRNDAVLRCQLEQKKLIRPMSDNEYEIRLAYYDKSVPELCKVGRQYIKNFELYGATTWYGWCNENWGTSWNSRRFERISDDIIRFETVAGVPEYVIAELARQYPNADVEHWWADDAECADTGHVTYKNGNVDEVRHYICGDKAREICAVCWGDRKLLHLDQHGVLKCSSCECS